MLFILCGLGLMRLCVAVEFALLCVAVSVMCR